MADPASNSPSQQSKSESHGRKGDATQAPDRPPRPSRSAEGELSQDDPDHELRGEDQLVDGVSTIAPAVAGGASPEEE